MKKFAFKLDPLLKLRRNQRDVCQQSLAEAYRHDGALVAQRRQTEADRDVQIDELRSLSVGGTDVDVDASSARRFYAAQLIGALAEIDAARARLARQIDERRQLLVRADQAVRSLELLAEKQQAEFRAGQERLESRELEETWQALHAREHLPC